MAGIAVAATGHGRQKQGWNAALQRNWFRGPLMFSLIALYRAYYTQAVALSRVAIPRAIANDPALAGAMRRAA